MSFWWEDGYVASAAESKQEKDRARRPDASGLGFLVKNTETKAHHLDAKWNPKLRQLVTLDGVGKQDTRIRVRCGTEGVILSEFEVHCKSGFIAVSGDGKMVAVAVLKEDTVDIYELTSGDLLLSLDGGRREGFWGSMYFLPGSNRLVELRSIEYSRGVSKRNIMRCWDLGFANRRDPMGDARSPSAWLAGAAASAATAPSPCEADDSDDDEVEEKKWEIQMWKGPNAISYKWDDDVIVASSEEERKVSTFEALTGNCRPTQNIAEGQFCAKIVFSSDCSFFALSHTGSCSIRDSKTNKMLSTIEMPDVPFPVTPLAFLQQDRLLLLRVNLDRHLILCEWRNPKDMYILREAGGTATDACAVSPDEKCLACWPHGFIEYFSMEAIIEAFKDKVPRMKKYTMVIMRNLFLNKRATVAVVEKAAVRSEESPKPVKSKPGMKGAKSGKGSAPTQLEARRDQNTQISTLETPLFWESTCSVDDNLFRYIMGFV